MVAVGCEDAELLGAGVLDPGDRERLEHLDAVALGLPHDPVRELRTTHPVREPVPTDAATIERTPDLAPADPPRPSATRLKIYRED